MNRLIKPYRTLQLYKSSKAVFPAGFTSNHTKRSFHISWKLNQDSTSSLTKYLYGRPLQAGPTFYDKHGWKSEVDLFDRAFNLSESSDFHNALSKNGTRVALLCSNDCSYVQGLLATWLVKNAVAVPLCPTHPVSELEYFISDSMSTVLLYSAEYTKTAMSLKDKLNITTIQVPFLEKTNSMSSSGFYEELTQRRNTLHTDLPSNTQDALIIFTSGTTGKPKGVVHTVGSLSAQIDSMARAWEWHVHDTVLHVLPLHHVHGIVNVLLTPLVVGAGCVMMPKFSPDQVWKALLSPLTYGLSRPVNMFMAVPTIYVKLLEYYKQQMDSTGSLHGISPSGVKDICSNHVRLMVSGSAALPVPVMERWRDVTGHTLLERYGMTEVGMALTNPLQAVRTPGAVGNPFPGVEARIYGSEGEHIYADSEHTTVKHNESGELQIRGKALFKEYWRKSSETKETFTESDGWFKTGDTAIFEDGKFRILGRTSVDIIKSGGYKISALEIERHLLSHDVIRDVAVVGVPDEKWGEQVAAVVVLDTQDSATTLNLQGLREWCRDRMPKYHIPANLRVLEEMPRNAMGKVNKKQLLVLFNDEEKTK